MKNKIEISIRDSSLAQVIMLDRNDLKGFFTYEASNVIVAFNKKIANEIVEYLVSVNIEAAIVKK
jgi:hypothetical protein